MGKIAGSIDAIIWASNVMKYAIMVLALLGVLASPRPAAVEDDNDLLDACKSGLACVTYMTGWADGSRSWYP